MVLATVMCFKQCWATSCISIVVYGLSDMIFKMYSNVAIKLDQTWLPVSGWEAKCVTKIKGFRQLKKHQVELKIQWWRMQENLLSAGSRRSLAKHRDGDLPFTNSLRSYHVPNLTTCHSFQAYTGLYLHLTVTCSPCRSHHIPNGERAIAWCFPCHPQPGTSALGRGSNRVKECRCTQERTWKPAIPPDQYSLCISSVPWDHAISHS